MDGVSGMREADRRRSRGCRGAGDRTARARPSERGTAERGVGARAGRGGPLLIGALVLLALPALSAAQDVQVSGFAGWRFGGSGVSPVDYQDLDIHGAGSFGGSSSVRLWGRNAVELYFSRAESAGRRRFEDSELEVAVSYLLVGLVHEVKTEGVRPFLGFAIGGARLRQSPGGTRTLFSAAGVAGVRVFASPHLGLRADGRLLFVTDDRGSSRTREPLERSSGLTLRADSIIQGELTVGLVLAF